MEGSPARGSKDDGNSGGRMRVFRYTATLVLCLALMTLCSCGGGNPNQITVTLTTAGGILSVDESNPTAVPPILPALNFTASVANDTRNLGVTWNNPTLTGSGCSGLGTGSGECGQLTNVTPFSVTYTPPSNVTTQITVTLTAKSIADTSVTKTASIIVVVVPIWATTNCNPAGVLPCVLPNGKNGVPYNQTISFTGGVSPYLFNSPTLPPCLHLTTSTTNLTATISGTPCNTGTTELSSTFTVTVTDSGGAPAVSQAFTISLDPAPPLSVTTTSLPPGFYDVQYNSSVVTQGGVSPLTFTFVPTAAGSLPAGAIAGLPPGLSANTTTGQITGIPTKQAAVTYPATYSFTVQVQDSALPTPQVQPATPLLLSITIQAPAPLSITTLSLPSGATATGYSGSLQATGGVLPYTWSLTQGQLPAGLTLDSLTNGSGSISGTPILVTTSTFTVQVADSEVDPVTGKPSPMTLTKQFTIPVIAGQNNNSLLKGSYAFLFNGFDKSGSVAIVGSFTADGAGTVTAGNEDVNRISGVATTLSLTGTYVIDATGDGRGTLELIATASQSTLTTDYQLVLDSEGNAHIFENNSTTTSTDIANTHGEGTVKLVVGSSFGAANFSGNYAFEFQGQDLSAKPAALAGVIYADGTGTLSQGTSDFNDAGALSSQSVSGNFLFLSANRGAIQDLTFQVPNEPQVSLNFVFYFVSSSDLYVLEIDSSTTTGLPTEFRLAGEMILQNPGTTFSNLALEGVSVATGTAANSSNSDIFAGLLTSTTCDGQTAVTLSTDENNAGTITAPSFSGACTIGSNGRAAFTGLGSSTSTTHVAVAYLTGPGAGFLLGGDPGVTTGLLEQQSGGPAFALTSVQGGYTLSAPFLVDAQSTNLLGQVTSDGAGHITGTVDEIDPPATAAPHLAQAFSSLISTLAPNGRGTLASGAPVPTGFPASSALYVVSPGSVRLLSTDPSSQHPELIFLTH